MHALVAERVSSEEDADALDSLLNPPTAEERVQQRKIAILAAAAATGGEFG